MRTLIATGIVSLALLVAALVAARPAHAHDRRPSFVAPKHWDVARCESRGNFSHRTVGGQYGGAWSWFVGTWNLDRLPRMPTRPWKATPRQQYVVYLRSLARGRYFGCRVILGQVAS